ncbi:nuclease-related domain-containing protein [Nocardia sp. NPDC057455]|uniref:nuclease-related domain-containing protein n=1 Tax=Nocardia sp. NPDC057455 TaxID=3346138 RepID=UPI003672DF54
MLVSNAGRTGIPPTERMVVEWMQSWNDGYKITGIAISGCYVPDRSNSGDGQEADLVVITPQTCLVIEVKGMLPRVSGVLSCSTNSRWRLSGTDEEPVHVRKGDKNPIGQVSDGFYNLKACAEKAGIDEFIAGLVLVVPYDRYPVTLEWGGPKPKGCEVRLADLSSLRAYFHRAGRRETSWTAERVHTLLTALGYGEEVTLAQLVAEGFTPERSQPKSVASEPSSRQDAPVTRTRRPVAADPSPVTPLPPARPSAPPASPAVDRPVDTGRFATDAVDHPDEPITTVRTAAASSRRSHGIRALAAAAVVAVIVGGVWVLAQTRTDTAEPQQTGNEVTQSVIEEPPVTPPPPPPAEAPLPAPAAPRGCYPFQPNC